MKTIEVVAAIIMSDKENTDKVFATQRGYGEFKGGWEFPGGKMEEGETREEALVREIREELATEITVDEFFKTIEYDYDTFHLIMHCFISHVVEGDLLLLEHESAVWLTVDELQNVEWLPADILLLDDLKHYMIK
ncbi:MAG: (deoxy)nucleoside triphosphate pyrophosphohydrolase [Clostridiales bacterium]|nr:(deoxy)nucleoside triphosphate pyrophosphohydrolase [Clostridiales bacterium]